jgi:hypothetical protein
MMVNNATARAVRAFFFLGDSTIADLLTEDGLELFDAVVEFAIDNED